VAVSRFDIYRARLQVNQSTDRRPVLILEALKRDPKPPHTELVLVAPLSSQWDLYTASVHFEVSDKDPDFPATGLKRRSYIIGSMPILIPVTSLETRYGALTGDLRDRFYFWRPTT
jgi:hypothetical protein